MCLPPAVRRPTGARFRWAWLWLTVATSGCKDEPSAAQERPPAAPIEAEMIAGATCNDEGEAMCRAATTIISCDAGRWVEVPCHGPEGCKKAGLLVSCDESLGKAGEACSKNDNYGCATDKASQLKCVAHKWTLVAQCRGPKACTTNFPYVSCDTTVARAGDPCEEDKSAACADDGKSVLSCKDGRFVEQQRCAASCKVEGLFVRCR
jgi:hypothetical protein